MSKAKGLLRVSIASIFEVLLALGTACLAGGGTLAKTRLGIGRAKG